MHAKAGNLMKYCLLPTKLTRINRAELQVVLRNESNKINWSSYTILETKTIFKDAHVYMSTTKKSGRRIASYTDIVGFLVRGDACEAVKNQINFPNGGSNDTFSPSPSSRQSADPFFARINSRMCEPRASYFCTLETRTCRPGWNLPRFLS